MPSAWAHCTCGFWSCSEKPFLFPVLIHGGTPDTFLLLCDVSSFLVHSFLCVEGLLCTRPELGSRDVDSRGTGMRAVCEG